jgi:hypothetical protein
MYISCTYELIKDWFGHSICLVIFPTQGLPNAVAVVLAGQMLVRGADPSKVEGREAAG